jgi:hypothetical protein
MTPKPAVQSISKRVLSESEAIESHFSVREVSVSDRHEFPIRIHKSISDMNDKDCPSEIIFSGDQSVDVIAQQPNSASGATREKNDKSEVRRRRERMVKVSTTSTQRREIIFEFSEILMMESLKESTVGVNVPIIKTTAHAKGTVSPLCLTRRDSSACIGPAPKLNPLRNHTLQLAICRFS